NSLTILSLLALVTACGGGEPKSIVVTNALDTERQELVAVPYVDFVDAFGSDSTFRIVDKATDVEIPYQLETNGAVTPQNILLYVLVPASGKLVLAVERSTPTPIAPRTYGRYVPERYDDFAWENDVVAFRMYGKA